MKKQHLEFLRLEFYDRTRVLNARLLELANKNYPGGIHIELEFTILEFLCTSSSFAFSRSFFFFLWIRFFGFSDRLQLHAFSKSVLQIVFGSSCIFQISSSYHLQIVLLLPSNLVLRFFKSSSSSCIFQINSSDHLHLHLCSSIELESEKFKFHVNKLLHLSTRTRVLEARFCH